MKNFLIKSINNIKFGYFPVFKEHNIVLATSLRSGGVSDAPYNSLNLALHTSDDTQNVINNRNIFFSTLEIDYKKIITLKQIHSNKIYYVSKANRGRGALRYEDSFAEGDGLITTDFNTPLVIFTADCLPIFFYEKKRGIIGIAHAGWKGSMLNIVKKMVEKIISLGGVVDNILVGIGPGIEGKCYEVGKEFLSKFDDRYFLIRDNKYYLDIVKVNYDKLIESGVKEYNIFLSNMCTYCNTKYFYSYRREKETGRMASVIMLKKRLTK